MASLLLPGAEAHIRQRLQELKDAQMKGLALPKFKRPPVVIAFLTPDLFQSINEARVATSRPPLTTPNVIFDGRHLFQSRCTSDRYTFDDVLDQIKSALDTQSSVVTKTHGQKYVNLVAAADRLDRYGNSVTDAAVFNASEYMANNVKISATDLFSIIPAGDTKKPH